MKKALAITLLIVFAAWMAIVHEPKALVSDTTLGAVVDVREGEGAEVFLLVELGSGERVEMAKPRNMPASRNAEVRMEVYESQWFGERSYRVRNWKLK